ETLLSDDVVVSIAFEDGSLAGVTYASGGPGRVGKERIDVLGRGHSVEIVDFRVVRLDRRTRRLRRQDKGHEAAVRAFRRMVVDGETGHSPIPSMRATLLAAASLGWHDRA